MATTGLSAAEQAAVDRSLTAQRQVRAFKQRIDRTVLRLAADVGELAADSIQAHMAVGSDSTRPYFSDDLGKLNVQVRRFEALRDLVKVL